MVRLVFRPYIQLWRTICTSVSLRAFTRVSPGFTLVRYSSPSFGSQQSCSHSNSFPWIIAGHRRLHRDSQFHFTHKLHARVFANVYGLLGPCFKTGHTMPCMPSKRKNPIWLKAASKPYALEARSSHFHYFVWREVLHSFLVITFSIPHEISRGRSSIMRRLSVTTSNDFFAEWRSVFAHSV